MKSFERRIIMKSLICAIIITALTATPVIAPAMQIIPVPKVLDQPTGGMNQMFFDMMLQDTLQQKQHERDMLRQKQQYEQDRLRQLQDMLRQQPKDRTIYLPGLNENQPGLLFEPDGQGGYQIFDLDGNFLGDFPD